MRISLKGVERIHKDFNLISKAITETKEKVPQEVAQFSSVYAKSIAPIYTGALIQAITSKVGKDGVAWLIVRNPNNFKRSSTKFNYPYYMTVEPSVLNWWGNNKRKSGEYDFMKKTYQAALKEFDIKIKQHIKRILK